MSSDNQPQAPGEKPRWITPHLDSLGTMDDVRANGSQPPNDGSGTPTVAAS